METCGSEKKKKKNTHPKKHEYVITPWTTNISDAWLLSAHLAKQPPSHD